MDGWIKISLGLEDFSQGPCGAMDNASDYGSEDSRFESWQGRFFLRHDKNAQETHWKQKQVASVGIEPATLALLAPRSNQLS